eukprot:7384907-Pyramimonas_sp.AAC.1
MGNRSARGVRRHRRRERMRTLPLEPSVDQPMGPRSAVLGGGGACGHCHWSLRWSSLGGHETLSVVAAT